MCYAGAFAVPNAAFGSGSGPVILHDVMCNGLENRLFDCPGNLMRRIGICSHSLDAGVICNLGKMQLHGMVGAHGYVVVIAATNFNAMLSNSSAVGIGATTPS